MNDELIFSDSYGSVNDYDPLEDDYLDADEEGILDTPALPSQMASPPARPGEGNRFRPSTGKKITQPAAKRLKDLFSKMPGKEPVLYGILELCDAALPVAQVNEKIAELARYHKSVYAPADLTALLEKAGGLMRVGEDGLPYNEEAAAEGVIVEIDGIEYLEPSTPPAAYWRVTEAGREFARGNNPAQKLANLLEEESSYIPIYQRVLKCCSAKNGASHEDITSLVDGDALAKQPLRTAPYFTNNLVRAGALEWRNAWFLTALGQDALDRMEQKNAVDLDAIRADLSKNKQ